MLNSSISSDYFEKCNDDTPRSLIYISASCGNAFLVIAECRADKNGNWCHHSIQSSLVACRNFHPSLTLKCYSKVYWLCLKFNIWELKRGLGPQATEYFPVKFIWRALSRPRTRCLANRSWKLAQPSSWVVGWETCKKKAVVIFTHLSNGSNWAIFWFWLNMRLLQRDQL